MTIQENGLQKIAVNISLELEKLYGEQMGFALLCFPFYQPGIGDYISNAQRKDMIKALREAANRLENKEIIPVTQGES